MDEHEICSSITRDDMIPLKALTNFPKLLC